MSEALSAGPDGRIVRGMLRQLAARSAALERGAAHRGWKVAFTTPQSRAAAGVDRQVIGYLTDATELAAGAEVAIAGWTRPMVEAELAIVVGDDLGVAAVAPAIEVVDVSMPLDAVEDVLAAGIFHRHYVLGAADRARAGGEVGDVRVRVLVDGELVGAQDDPCSVVGALPAIVATVAEELARHGERLRPRDVILGGATTSLHPVAAGQQVRVEAEGLGRLELTFR